MSDPFNCEDKALLVAYLYDEADPAERERVDAHLAACAACREEVDGLRGIRTTLADWAPSTRALGYRLVQTDPAQEPRHRSWWPLPVWAQAAAAVLVVGVAAGLANLDISVGRDGVTLHTGWQRQPAETPASQAEVVPAGPAQPWRTDLAALEKRLRTDFAAQAVPAAPPGAAQASAARVAPNENQMLARVRELVAESEQRQERELALRVAQLQRDFDAQRVADLKRIQDNFGQLGGWTTTEVARQRDVLNYLLRASQQQPIK